MYRHKERPTLGITALAARNLKLSLALAAALAVVAAIAEGNAAQAAPTGGFATASVTPSEISWTLRSGLEYAELVLTVVPVTASGETTVLHFAPSAPARLVPSQLSGDGIYKYELILVPPTTPELEALRQKRLRDGQVDQEETRMLREQGKLPVPWAPVTGTLSVEGGSGRFTVPVPEPRQPAAY